MSLRSFTQPVLSFTRCHNHDANLAVCCLRPTAQPHKLNLPRTPQRAASLDRNRLASSRRSVVISAASHDKHPTISAKERQRVEDLIRETLLRELPEKRSNVEDKIQWGMFVLCVAFGLYKFLFELPGRYNNFADIESPTDWVWFIGLITIIQGPIGCIFDFIEAYIELKLHERECVAFCGEESIK